MNWEKLCPNLTIENEIVGSHKIRLFTFLKKWDITLPQILIIYQWTGKNWTLDPLRTNGTKCAKTLREYSKSKFEWFRIKYSEKEVCHQQYFKHHEIKT